MKTKLYPDWYTVMYCTGFITFTIKCKHSNVDCSFRRNKMQNGENAIYITQELDFYFYTTNVFFFGSSISFIVFPPHFHFLVVFRLSINLSNRSQSSVLKMAMSAYFALQISSTPFYSDFLKFFTLNNWIVFALVNN